MITSAVSIDPEIMGGTPCFRDTRVPIQFLLDFLEAGDTIEAFLEDYPTVSREQVVAYLNEGRDVLVERVA
ncbi:MAG TPA: DUF433 domain-containing protein [Rhizomicrobium sp.]|jgi:uncharacterized protein (DUF433 family)